MSRKPKRHLEWRLLFRLENGQPVHLYEPLSFAEVNVRLQQGWRVIE